ncbi:MAG: putative DNA-binding domain-containing protein [Solirubrobacterales bacterium]
MSSLPLARLQRWMHEVVVYPGTVEEAPAERIEDVILPSATLTAAERIEIYHAMYPLRMGEALASDYPALHHYLGDGAFGELVRVYVQAHPSRGYTLNRLGDHLPEFVKTAPGLRRPEFCHDLARLELAISEVFDAPETPPLSEAAIAAVPPEAWERAVLTPVAAFRLLSFRYPVNAYLQTVKDENHDHPKARLKDTWVAVYRRDYAGYRLELTRAAHDLLAELVAGRPLGEALARAVRAGGRRAPSEQELFRWFREWVSGGVFGAVTIASDR